MDLFQNNLKIYIYAVFKALKLQPQAFSTATPYLVVLSLG